jgi:hypothetical protein
MDSVPSEDWHLPLTFRNLYFALNGHESEGAPKDPVKATLWPATDPAKHESPNRDEYIAATTLTNGKLPARVGRVHRSERYRPFRLSPRFVARSVANASSAASNSVSSSVEFAST